MTVYSETTWVSGRNVRYNGLAYMVVTAIEGYSFLVVWYDSRNTKFSLLSDPLNHVPIPS